MDGWMNVSCCVLAVVIVVVAVVVGCLAVVLRYNPMCGSHAR